MDAELKEKWIRALRGGYYQQCQGKLRVFKDGLPSYCCLGVLCEVAGVKISPNGDTTEAFRGEGPLYQEVYDLLGVSASHSTLPNRLVEMNDAPQYEGQKKSFAEIADWIEENVPTS